MFACVQRTHQNPCRVKERRCAAPRVRTTRSCLPVAAPRSALRAPRSALRAPRSALRAPRSALRAPRSALRAPRSALRALRSALRAPRSAPRPAPPARTPPPRPRAGDRPHARRRAGHRRRRRLLARGRGRVGVLPPPGARSYGCAGERLFPGGGPLPHLTACTAWCRRWWGAVIRRAHAAAGARPVPARDRRAQCRGCPPGHTTGSAPCKTRELSVQRAGVSAAGFGGGAPRAGAGRARARAHARVQPPACPEDTLVVRGLGSQARIPRPAACALAPQAQEPPRARLTPCR